MNRTTPQRSSIQSARRNLFRILGGCGLASAAWLLCAPPLEAACVNITAQETQDWASMLITKAMGDDDACRAAAPDRDDFASNNACNVFVGRVMARIYGLSTFVGTDGSFLKANDIAAQLPIMPGWVELGTANDQSTLDAARDAADNKSLVLAVWPNPDTTKPGHVALVGPGPMTASTKWGLNVPVAASFSLDAADAAFIGQPLSCAFGADKKATTQLWKYSG